MADKVAKTGVQKEKGYLYYLGKDGNVWASRMARGSDKGGDKKMVGEAGVKENQDIYTSSTKMVTYLELKWLEAESNPVLN